MSFHAVYHKEKFDQFSFGKQIYIKVPTVRTEARAFVALSGFDVRFTDAEHHLKVLKVQVKGDRFVTDALYGVTLVFALTDKHLWEKKIEGFISFTVLIFDGEPDVVGTDLTVGVSSYDPDRSGHVDQYLPYPYGYDTSALPFLSGFDFYYDGSDDQKVYSIYAQFTAHGTEPGAPIEQSGYFGFNSHCAVHTEDCNEQWHSLVRGTVLFLPRSRYQLQPVRTEKHGFKGGRYERSDEYILPGVTKEDRCGFVMDEVLAAFYNTGNHPLHRVTNEVRIDGIALTPAGATVKTVSRGGIRDFSNNWDDEYAVSFGGQLIGRAGG